ncbi:MAG: T9SS type A sorting domain-containing protein, partial [Saprospiraceae bacterium]|nr:T9SS type A sorting domain-containing protein [Saprospiraceae bacterium]
YVVFHTAWDVFAVATEWSPEGRVIDEFEEVWGYDMETNNKEHPWAQDMASVFTALQVVDNNSQDNIGGGGTPRQPLAPPFDLTDLPNLSQLNFQLELFPNPASDLINVRHLGDKAVEIEKVLLYDTEGKVRQSWDLNGWMARNYELPLEQNIDAGIYYLEFSDKVGRRVVEKLIISKF